MLDDGRFTNDGHDTVFESPDTIEESFVSLAPAAGADAYGDGLTEGGALVQMSAEES